MRSAIATLLRPPTLIPRSSATRRVVDISDRHATLETSVAAASRRVHLPCTRSSTVSASDSAIDCSLSRGYVGIGGHRLHHQLQPLVEPQLGQAWHEPARIICTPHCMHIGASLARGLASVRQPDERCRRDW